MIECIEIKGVSGEINEAAVRSKYAALTQALIKKNITITTMESCTSGQIASLITDTEGSSAIMKGACITYSNEAKVMEGIPAETIQHFGVYSAETAQAMSSTCQKKYRAAIGIGVTGSFGNVDPANADSVPGEVFFAISYNDSVSCYHCLVPAQSSRLAYKLYMADVVADRVTEILSI